jgi:hypothetical protein
MVAEIEKTINEERYEKEEDGNVEGSVYRVFKNNFLEYIGRRDCIGH